MGNVEHSNEVAPQSTSSRLARVVFGVPGAAQVGATEVAFLLLASVSMTASLAVIVDIIFVAA